MTKFRQTDVERVVFRKGLLSKTIDYDTDFGGGGDEGFNIPLDRTVWINEDLTENDETNRIFASASSGNTWIVANRSVATEPWHMILTVKPEKDAGVLKIEPYVSYTSPFITTLQSNIDVADVNVTFSSFINIGVISSLDIDSGKVILLTNTIIMDNIGDGSLILWDCNIFGGTYVKNNFLSGIYGGIVGDLVGNGLTMTGDLDDEINLSNVNVLSGTFQYTNFNSSEVNPDSISGCTFNNCEINCDDVSSGCTFYNSRVRIIAFGEEDMYAYNCKIESLNVYNFTGEFIMKETIMDGFGFAGPNYDKLRSTQTRTESELGTITSGTTTINFGYAQYQNVNLSALSGETTTFRILTPNGNDNNDLCLLTAHAEKSDAIIKFENATMVLDQLDWDYSLNQLVTEGNHTYIFSIDRILSGTVYVSYKTLFNP